AHLASFLTERQNPFEMAPPTRQGAYKKLSNVLIGENRCQQPARHQLAASRFLSDVLHELPKHVVNRQIAGLRLGFGVQHLAELHLVHHAENVFLAGEIAEEGSLANIRSLGDVFDRGAEEAPLGKEPQRGKKDSLARFTLPALPPAGGRGGFNIRTHSHSRLIVNYCSKVRGCVKRGHLPAPGHVWSA